VKKTRGRWNLDYNREQNQGKQVVSHRGHILLAEPRLTAGNCPGAANFVAFYKGANMNIIFNCNFHEGGII